MPRSASRDLADRFAGPGGTRHRYFATFNHHERWKIFLSRIAVAGVVVWGALLLFTKKFDSQISHGPLANVHAPWDAKCEACHRDSKGDNFLDARARWHDFTCEKCHAAPTHTHKMKEKYDNEDCSTCHQDHNGRDFSLVKLSDSHCIRCHGEIGPYTTSSLSTQHERWKITNFATDHPGFRSLWQDKGRVPGDAHRRTMKFSHSLHMTPGMVLTPGAKGALTATSMKKDNFGGYLQLPPSLKDNPDAPMTLECRNCHQMGTNPNGYNDGRYFNPIKYEVHCVACHPTTVPPTVTEGKEVVPQFDVPHGLFNHDLMETVQKEYAIKLLAGNPKLSAPLDIRSAQRLKDENVIAYAKQVLKLSDEAFKNVNNQNCAKCHLFEFESPAAKPRISHRVIPPEIPLIWLAQAKFSHAAHRATDCLSCHPNTKSQLNQAGHTLVNENEPVNIPGIASCRECHAPQSTKPDGSLVGGVRHGCTDCHAYHEADHMHRGPGRSIFAPKNTLDFQQFLKGR